MMTRKKAMAVCGALVLSMSLAACGGGKGGDTTCGEFMQMSAADQKEAIHALMSEEGDSPANGMVTLGVGSAKLFCSTVGTDSSKIREINGK